jgi:hypothetical protein
MQPLPTLSQQALDLYGSVTGSSAWRTRTGRLRERWTSCDPVLSFAIPSDPPRLVRLFARLVVLQLGSPGPWAHSSRDAGAWECPGAVILPKKEYPHAEALLAKARSTPIAGKRKTWPTASAKSAVAVYASVAAPTLSPPMYRLTPH